MILIACVIFVLVVLVRYSELFGSVRRSLPDVEEFPTCFSLVGQEWFSLVGQEWFSLVDNIKNPSLPPLQQPPPSVPPIRWQKGDLIGCGAFGSVYLSMNLDSGELIAVKQVLTAATTASKKKKAQAHIKELEEEVKLLKNLNHPNIVGYLGTLRDEETVNILLEYVPGGSISSLLGKFGAFTEAVIRTYTKQLLLGLEYLHRNGIMHRDIKGANILVDAKGCIKLADFGASKQVVELATMTGAKSMRGTPYWMAPEVILQTGHTFSADIWSVGCTVIEMATGKPPWSQQYQEVAALFYIGTTKSYPPIPEHISAEAKDFLLQCFQEEPNLRPAASELLQHPFVTGDSMESYPVIHNPVMENSETPSPLYGKSLKNFKFTNCSSLGSLQFSTVSAHYWRANCTDDVMCQIDDDDFTLSSIKSFNPITEPSDELECKFGGSSQRESNSIILDTDQQIHLPACCSGTYSDGDKELSVPAGPLLYETDDELIGSKIRVFLDGKAIKLKKLQIPLSEEFFNSLNAAASPSYVDSRSDETTLRFLKLPPKSRSPSWGTIASPSAAINVLSTGSPGCNGRRASNACGASDQTLKDSPSPPLSVWKVLLDDAQHEPNNPSLSFLERQRKWKEELGQELERKREMTRQARVGGNTSLPKEENTDNNMRHIDEDDIMLSEAKLYSSLMPGSFKSFNPITEPSDEWECKFGGCPQRESNSINLNTTQQIHLPAFCSGTHGDGDKELSFPAGPSLFETDDELIESKIKVFLDGKALELNKLQTPLYEEFFNGCNAAAFPSYADCTCDETTLRFLKLPPKSRSPSWCPIASPSAAIDVLSTASPGSNGRRASNICGANDQILKDTPSPPLSVWKVLLDDAQQDPNNPSMSFLERQRKWKEELDQELERKREMMRQAGGGGNTSSPKEDNTDNDMCHIDEDDILLSLSEVKLYSSLMPGSFKSFNPITEPSDEWECKFGGSPHRESNSINLDTTQQIHLPACCSGTYSDGDKELSFPAGPSLFETDDELIKSKIRVFLDGK
ncbi:hypothetical protein UlMin_046114, partial [Ulmus minor]